jgi:hypothetical protein
MKAELNIIAQHATEAGWSIMIDKTSEGFTGEMFRVSRVAPGGKFLPLEAKRTEAEARKVANGFWLRAMGREKMIGCGPLAA